MAILTIQVGALSRSKSAADAKANALLAAYGAAIGAQGTNAQKIDAVLDALVRHMREEAQRHRRNEEIIASQAAIEAETNALIWE